jgi:hypothetical protein
MIIDCKSYIIQEKAISDVSFPDTILSLNQFKHEDVFCRVPSVAFACYYSSLRRRIVRGAPRTCSITDSNQVQTKQYDDDTRRMIKRIAKHVSVGSNKSLAKNIFKVFVPYFKNPKILIRTGKKKQPLLVLHRNVQNCSYRLLSYISAQTEVELYNLILNPTLSL